MLPPRTSQFKYLIYFNLWNRNWNGLMGQGGPWDHIMENEFEYLSDRGGHGGHLAEKFLNK